MGLFDFDEEEYKRKRAETKERLKEKYGFEPKCKDCFWWVMDDRYKGYENPRGICEENRFEFDAFANDSACERFAKEEDDIK